MARQQPIEIFMPPNILKAKVGGGGGIDLSAIKRAEEALDDLEDEFAGWIVQDVDRLQAARNAFAKKRGEETQGALFRAAHDLKVKTTFDFPLVARVASSLSTLTDGGGGATVPLNLIDAHVDAIKIFVRDNIRNPDDATASVLVGELERQATAYLEKQGAK